jgi:hypothetical protein
MDLHRIVSIGLLTALTLASGMADAKGFVYASQIWSGGTFHIAAVLRSALGFAVGISLYYVILRDMNTMGVRAPEVQTLAWFSVTLVSVAVFSGTFLTWRRIDQLVAVGVLAGIAWLMARTQA